jgi:uncharacterized membrane protein YgcG
MFAWCRLKILSCANDGVCDVGSQDVASKRVAARSVASGLADAFGATQYVAVLTFLLAACAGEKLALAPPAGVDFSGTWKLNQADSDDPQRLLQNQTEPGRAKASSGGSTGGGRSGGGGPPGGGRGGLPLEQHFGISEDGQRLVEVVGVKRHMDGFTMSRVWDRMQ